MSVYECVGSAAAVGHSGPGEIQKFDSILHPRLDSGRGCLRYHKYDTCPYVVYLCVCVWCMSQAATVASVAAGVVYWGY